MKRRTNLPNSSGKVRAWSFFGWLAMAAVFGSTAWFFAIEPIAVAAGNWWQSRDYRAVNADVVQRTGKDAEGSFTYYVAQYRDGERTHETTRLTVLDDESVDEPSNETVLKTLEKAFSEKRPLTVWVSPRKPEIAVVNRDLPLRSLVARAPMAIGFSIFTMAGVMGAIGCLGNFAYYRRMVDASGLWLFSALWCGFVFPMFIVLAQARGGEWVATAVIGFFALIGVLMLYGAVAGSLWGVRKTDASGKPLDEKAMGPTKRGGFGGRGDDYDKD
jgi:hypothetical protein